MEQMMEIMKTLKLEQRYKATEPITVILERE